MFDTIPIFYQNCHKMRSQNNVRLNQYANFPYDNILSHVSNFKYILQKKRKKNPSNILMLFRTSKREKSQNIIFRKKTFVKKKEVNISRKVCLVCEVDGHFNVFFLLPFIYSCVLNWRHCSGKQLLLTGNA